jgi:hypothetical protein
MREQRSKMTGTPDDGDGGGLMAEDVRGSYS